MSNMGRVRVTVLTGCFGVFSISPFLISSMPSIDVLTQNCRKLSGWHIWSQFSFEIGPISRMWYIQTDRLVGLNTYFQYFFFNYGVTFMSFDLSEKQICPEVHKTAEGS